MRASAARVAALIAIWLATAAHVGSPDTYFEGPAGPYQIRVVVRSPGVVPGLAQVSVEVLTPVAVTRVAVLPIYWDPRTAGSPPPDVAKPLSPEARLFTAALWLMRGGAYGLKVTVDGAAGTGSALVPVQAVATRRLPLQGGLAALLVVLGVLLLAGAAAVVGGAAREGGLTPGLAPDPRAVRRGRIAMGVSTLILAGLLVGARAWWNAVDAAHAAGLFRPLNVAATVRRSSSSDIIRLEVEPSRPFHPSPLIPDHGHMVHLFLMRDSTYNAFAHLHPAAVDSFVFESRLPPLPAGRYAAFADIVNESGFAQTLTAQVDVPPAPGAWKASDADDSWIIGAPSLTDTVAALADGSRMTWRRGAGPIFAGEDARLVFAMVAPDGRTAELEPYMGMPGHLALARRDRTVFAHLHTAGTISFASQEAFELRAPGDSILGTLARRMAALEAPDHAGHMAARDTSSVVSFPYAFPRSGAYRLWVQVKRKGRILTGVFDCEIEDRRAS